MKNLLLFSLLILFTIVNIIDAVSSFFILRGEANPVFLLTKSIWFLIGIKVLINTTLWVMYFVNTYKHEGYYFTILLIIILMCCTIGYAAYGNINAINNPKIIEEASKLTTEQKVAGYHTYMFYMYIYPLLVGIITYLVFIFSKHTIGLK
jgi:hypothetical protein